MVKEIGVIIVVVGSLYASGVKSSEKVSGFSCQSLVTTQEAAKVIQNECRHDMPMLSPVSDTEVLVCCTKVGSGDANKMYYSVATYK